MGEARRKATGRGQGPFDYEPGFGELRLRVVTAAREPMEAFFPLREVGRTLASMDGPMDGVVARFGDAKDRHDARIGAMLEVADLLGGAVGARLADGRESIHAFRTLLWIAATQTPGFRDGLLLRCGRDRRVVLTVFLDAPPVVRTTLSDAVGDLVPGDDVRPGETRSGHAMVVAEDDAIH